MKINENFKIMKIMKNTKNDKNIKKMKNYQKISKIIKNRGGVKKGSFFHFSIKIVTF